MTEQAGAAGVTLYRNGVCHTGTGQPATAFAVRGGRIVWVGNEPDGVGPTRTVDLAGGYVTPAFVDAHVHSTSTGLALTGLDLSSARSLTEALQAVEAATSASGGRVVLGHGWDETTWPEGRPPTRQELDRAAYGGVVYLSRIDVHSAVVSSALLAAAPEIRAAAGFDDSGHVSRDAHHLARTVARESIGPGQRRALHRAALQHAASLGIATVHELAGPDISSAEDLQALLALTAEEPLPEVVPYWGQLGGDGITTAQRLGARGAAGDLFADGSIGSHTAALRDPYADADHCGHAYVTAAQVRDHVVACTEAGLQAGFHAIGDGALDVVAAGLAEAEQQLGAETLRAARHRLEHVEMVSAAAVEVFARLGVVVSVQPAFDRLWGGEDGMYAQRLGVERALALNPFRAMADAGVVLALGSDAPVTPLDPWGSIRAAVRHRTPGSGLDATEAFRAHTAGGHRAAGRDDAGELRVGAPATFAVWERAALTPDGLPDLDAPDPRCRLTVRRGEVVFSR